MPWDEVYAEACILEHAITPRVEDRLVAALGDPQTCPHGHPIPPTDLTEPVRIGAPLAQVDEGAEVTVAGVTRTSAGNAALSRAGRHPARRRAARRAKSAAWRTGDHRDRGRPACDLARARAHGDGRVMTRLLIALNAIGYLWEIRVGGSEHALRLRFGRSRHGARARKRRARSGTRVAGRPVVAHRHRRLPARRSAAHRREHDVALVSRTLHRTRAWLVAHAAGLYGLADRGGVGRRLFQSADGRDGRRERRDLWIVRRALRDRT